MAWTSEDQNPNLSPSAAYGGTNYAAQLNAAAYYNPMGSGTTMAPGSGTAAAQGGQSYADRLNAAAPQEPWETRETSRELATSADRTAAARRYTSSVSKTRGGTMQAQGERSLDLLHPYTVQRFALAAREAHAEGIPVGIYSAYRPPGMGVGGFKDKYRSTHAYGLGFDVNGIGRPGSNTAKRWYEIATKYGLYNPYGPSHRKEWNHYQAVPVRSANQIPGLRETITAEGPLDPQAMWAASGVDPEGVPYAGNPFGVKGGRGQTVMAGGNVPSPRQRPQRTDVSRAYAPAPEAMEGPFDAVMARSANRRPQPPTPRQRPQRDTLSAPQAPQPQAQGAYTVRRGDNLSKIAQRELGDANRWREIAAANRLRDPNVIRPGQKLVIPDSPTRTVDVPQPRLRPSREVDMPTPRPRPERGANVPTPRMRPTRGQPAPGFDTRRLDDAAGPRQPVPPRPGPLAEEPEVPWLERQFVNGKPRPGPVIPRTRLETAQLNYRRPDFSLVAGGNLGTPETRMSIDQTMRGGPPSPPAELGMDTSGLIREPTAEERAIQGGARMPLPTGAQPIDPAVAATIRRTPVVIVDPRSPPVYVSPSGVRIWATR